MSFLIHLRMSMSLLALSACAGGPSAERPERGLSDAEVGPDVVADAAPDQSPGSGLGQACLVPEDCRLGECVDARCRAPCDLSGDCTEPFRCVSRPLGAYCHRSCAVPADCDKDERCAATNDEERLCLPRGPASSGMACTEASDCSSLACDRGLCLQDCIDARGCRADETCLMVGVEGLCVTAGELSSEAPCTEGAECQSGVCRGGACTVACDPDALPDECPNDRICVEYAQVSLCERPCVTSEACGPRGVCLIVAGRRLCGTRGESAGGSACTAGRQCLSGLCEADRCVYNCEPPCPAGHECLTDCPAGHACINSPSGGLCRVAGSVPDGQACTTSEQCSTALCAAGRCARDCAAGRSAVGVAAGASCAADEACVSFLAGDFCFQRCGQSDDCSSEAYCEHAFAESSVCYWRGSKVDGARCEFDRECHSGACAAQTCLASCADGRCSPGLSCALHNGEPRCTPEPRPAGSSCTEARECGGGASCVAGVCNLSCREGCAASTVCASDGSCRPACTVDDDCVPGASCAVMSGACSVGAEVEPSGLCASDFDCVSGHCREGRCVARCGACAEPTSCASDGFCRASTGQLGGELCRLDADCIGGVCARGVCADTCASGLCPTGFDCVRIDDVAVCLSACEDGLCNVDRTCRRLSASEVCIGGHEGSNSAAPCESDAACDASAPRCENGLCRGVCDYSSCAEAFVCVPPDRDLDDDDESVCLPRGRLELGQLCAADVSCASGRCRGGRCFRACSRPCPSGEACVDWGRGERVPRWGCAVECPGDVDCLFGLSCRRDALGDAACY